MTNILSIRRVEYLPSFAKTSYPSQICQYKYWNAIRIATSKILDLSYYKLPDLFGTLKTGPILLISVSLFLKYPK